MEVLQRCETMKLETRFVVDDGVVLPAEVDEMSSQGEGLSEIEAVAPAIGDAVMRKSTREDSKLEMMDPIELCGFSVNSCGDRDKSCFSCSNSSNNDEPTFKPFQVIVNSDQEKVDLHALRLNSLTLESEKLEHSMADDVEIRDVLKEAGEKDEGFSSAEYALPLAADRAVPVLGVYRPNKLNCDSILFDAKIEIDTKRGIGCLHDDEKFQPILLSSDESRIQLKTGAPLDLVVLGDKVHGQLHTCLTDVVINEEVSGTKIERNTKNFGISEGNAPLQNSSAPEFYEESHLDHAVTVDGRMLSHKDVHTVFVVVSESDDDHRQWIIACGESASFLSIDLGSSSETQSDIDRELKVSDHHLPSPVAISNDDVRIVDSQYDQGRLLPSPYNSTNKSEFTNSNSMDEVQLETLITKTDRSTEQRTSADVVPFDMDTISVISAPARLETSVNVADSLRSKAPRESVSGNRNVGADVEFCQKQVATNRKSVSFKNEFPQSNLSGVVRFPDASQTPSYLSQFCHCLSLKWIFDQVFLQEDYLLSMISSEERKAAIEGILLGVPDVSPSFEDDDSTPTDSESTLSFKNEPRENCCIPIPSSGFLQANVIMPIDVDDPYYAQTLTDANSICHLCRTAGSDRRRVQFRCPSCCAAFHNDCAVAWLSEQSHQRCPCCQMELIATEKIFSFVQKRKHYDGVQHHGIWDINDFSFSSSASAGSRCGKMITAGDGDESSVDSDLSDSFATSAAKDRSPAALC